MKIHSAPKSCCIPECPNSTPAKDTGHPLKEYCALCRATIQKHSRGSEPGDYTKGIARLWSIKHACAWCGGRRAVGPDKDGDPICAECKALPGPEAYVGDRSAMETTCQVA